MVVVNKFIDPILQEAVAKKRAARQSGEVVEKDINGDREVKDGDTLLDHLVNYTEGELLFFKSISQPNPFHRSKSPPG